MKKAVKKVSSVRNRWTISVDDGTLSHIVVAFQRYPLKICVDLGEIHKHDFQSLAKFFGERMSLSSLTLDNQKWTFVLDSYCHLVLSFAKHPLAGTIDFGELSPDDAHQLSAMFAQH